jgi:hypothetical protein
MAVVTVLDDISLIIRVVERLPLLLLIGAVLAISFVMQDL